MKALIPVSSRWIGIIICLLLVGCNPDQLVEPSEQQYLLPDLDLSKVDHITIENLREKISFQKDQTQNNWQLASGLEADDLTVESLLITLKSLYRGTQIPARESDMKQLKLPTWDGTLEDELTVKVALEGKDLKPLTLYLGGFSAPPSKKDVQAFGMANLVRRYIFLPESKTTYLVDQPLRHIRPGQSRWVDLTFRAPRKIQEMTITSGLKQRSYHRKNAFSSFKDRDEKTIPIQLDQFIGKFLAGTPRFLDLLDKNECAISLSDDQITHSVEFQDYTKYRYRIHIGKPSIYHFKDLDGLETATGQLGIGAGEMTESEPALAIRLEIHPPDQETPIVKNGLFRSTAITPLLSFDTQ